MEEAAWLAPWHSIGQQVAPTGLALTDPTRGATPTSSSSSSQPYLHTCNTRTPQHIYLFHICNTPVCLSTSVHQLLHTQATHHYTCTTQSLQQICFTVTTHPFLKYITHLLHTYSVHCTTPTPHTHTHSHRTLASHVTPFATSPPQTYKHAHYPTANLTDLLLHQMYAKIYIHTHTLFFFSGLQKYTLSGQTANTLSVVKCFLRFRMLDLKGITL